MRPLLAVLILINMTLAAWLHSAQADPSLLARASAGGQAREPDADLWGLLEDSESDDDVLISPAWHPNPAHGSASVRPVLFGRASSPPRLPHPPQA
jgi:hypothetical protein